MGDAGLENSSALSPGGGMANKSVHIVPSGDRWAVRRSDAERDSSHRTTQAEAIAQGRETAQREQAERGYADWSRANVVARKGECDGVDTVLLRVVLQPLSNGG
jgi:hypothetical protein